MILYCNQFKVVVFCVCKIIFTFRLYDIIIYKVMDPCNHTLDRLPILQMSIKMCLLSHPVDCELLEMTVCQIVSSVSPTVPNFYLFLVNNACVHVASTLKSCLPFLFKRK